ncbi:MAG TPA: hypothetical protein VJ583_08555 [Nitrososphaeraceae archaeon]|nr:hypothetical protein [Nitrososphaeraceae archaeon]
MQNEEKRQRKRNIFFEFEQMYKDNNNISSELQRKNDIECYDKIMESYLNYHSIVSIYVRKFMERPKIFTIPKVKSMLKNINHMMVFFILL